MGLLEVLTVIFVVLKLTGVIAWSWWLVVLPSIITAVILVTGFTLQIIVAVRTKRQFDKIFEDDSFFK